MINDFEKVRQRIRRAQKPLRPGYDRPIPGIKRSVADNSNPYDERSLLDERQFNLSPQERAANMLAGYGGNHSQRFSDLALRSAGRGAALSNTDQREFNSLQQAVRDQAPVPTTQVVPQGSPTVAAPGDQPNYLQQAYAAAKPQPPVDTPPGSQLGGATPPLSGGTTAGAPGVAPPPTPAVGAVPTTQPPQVNDAQLLAQFSALQQQGQVNGSQLQDWMKAHGASSAYGNQTVAPPATPAGPGSAGAGGPAPPGAPPAPPPPVTGAGPGSATPGGPNPGATGTGGAGPGGPGNAGAGGPTPPGVVPTPPAGTPPGTEPPNPNPPPPDKSPAPPTGTTPDYKSLYEQLLGGKGTPPAPGAPNNQGFDPTAAGFQNAYGQAADAGLARLNAQKAQDIEDMRYNLAGTVGLDSGAWAEALTKTTANYALEKQQLLSNIAVNQAQDYNKVAESLREHGFDMEKMGGQAYYDSLSDQRKAALALAMQSGNNQFALTTMGMEMTFDSGQKDIDRKIQNNQFISQQEYDTLRQNKYFDSQQSLQTDRYNREFGTNLSGYQVQSELTRLKGEIDKGNIIAEGDVKKLLQDDSFKMQMDQTQAEYDRKYGPGKTEAEVAKEYLDAQTHAQQNILMTEKDIDLIKMDNDHGYQIDLIEKKLGAELGVQDGEHAFTILQTQGSAAAAQYSLNERKGKYGVMSTEQQADRDALIKKGTGITPEEQQRLAGYKNMLTGDDDKELTDLNTYTQMQKNPPKQGDPTFDQYQSLQKEYDAGPMGQLDLTKLSGRLALDQFIQKAAITGMFSSERAGKAFWNAMDKAGGEKLFRDSGMYDALREALSGLGGG